MKRITKTICCNCGRDNSASTSNHCFCGNRIFYYPTELLTDEEFANYSKPRFIYEKKWWQFWK